MLLLNGCSFLGFHSSVDTISITKSPVRVVASGELSKTDYEYIHRMIDTLNRQPFVDYTFTPITVTVSGSEQVIEKVSDSNAMIDPQRVEE